MRAASRRRCGSSVLCDGGCRRVGDSFIGRCARYSDAVDEPVPRLTLRLVGSNRASVDHKKREAGRRQVDGRVGGCDGDGRLGLHLVLCQRLAWRDITNTIEVDSQERGGFEGRQKRRNDASV